MPNELLTVEEFAQKLKIGRSTLFDWVNKGILVRGKHFIKIGRILRFIWSDDMFASLAEAAAVKQPAAARKKTSSITPGINWDY